MDFKSKVVLISIRPNYVNLIESNIKKIEFRKNNFTQNIDKFLVYCTSPVSKIVGYFESDLIEEQTPINLWNTYSNIGGIKREDFFKYYENKDFGVGIHISKYLKFKRNVLLEDFNLPVPQSFMYISLDTFDKIITFSNT